MPRQAWLTGRVWARAFLDRIPVSFEHHRSRSWPGLSRPPRLYLLCAFKFEVAGTSSATTPLTDSKRSKSGLRIKVLADGGCWFPSAAPAGHEGDGLIDFIKKKQIISFCQNRAPNGWRQLDTTTAAC